VLLAEFIDDSGFDIAESLFAFALEVQTNRAAYALLYHVVSVDEPQSEPSG